MCLWLMYASAMNGTAKNVFFTYTFDETLK